MNDEQPLMTHEEVCELAGVTRQTLWNWRKDRNFPTALWNMATRSLMFRRAAVLEWLEENETDDE